MKPLKIAITRSLCSILLLTSGFARAQSVDFELKTSPSIDFNFNTMSEYINGIVVPNALELKVNSVGTQWDLYVGATTTSAGQWNVVTTYSTTGASPTVNILQARVYNANNTSQSGTSFFPLTDISSPTYVIGSNSNDIPVNCGDAIPTGTNQPGDYSSSPGCYKFKVDLKIAPGFNYRPGQYTLRVDYILIEDL